MLLKIYSDNPYSKQLDQVVEILRHDGLVIYPTDGVYAIGCRLDSARGIERLKRIKGDKEHSVIFESLSQISDYCRVDNATFKILKQHLPGAFTFILNASSRMPNKMLSKRKTIGVRMPDHPIVQALCRELGCPMASVSVRDNEEVEFMTDPTLLEESYAHEVDCVIDGGLGNMTPSTIVDLSQGEVEILRQGAGELR